MGNSKETIRIYKQNKETALSLIFFVAIVAKVLQHFVLPDYYYYDNFRICEMVKDLDYKRKWPGSYEVCADFFRNINFFKFDSMLQWSMLGGVLLTIVIILIFSKTEGMDKTQMIFALMYVGILNIYIFNIGKDAIQFLIFLVLYVLMNLKLPQIIKVLASFGVLYWESTFYRDYYIIIAFFFIAVYWLLGVLRKFKAKMTTMKIIFVIIMLYVIVFAFLSVAKVTMNEGYNEIMSCKAHTTELGANSTIDDKINHNKNTVLYMGNYIINSIRMAFPIELVKGGIFYFPFIVFEAFLIYFVIKAFRQLYLMERSQVIALAIFMGYFLGSVLFEPDFGSFVRHEAATFPVAYLFIFTPKNWKNDY